MKNATMTIGTHGCVRTGDSYLMDARLRVPAPTDLTVRGTTVFAVGIEYPSADVLSSASKRPPG